MSTAPDATIEAAEGARNPVLHLLASYGKPYIPHFTLGLVGQTLAQVPGRVPGLVIGVAFDAVFFQSAAYRLPIVPDAWIPEGRVAQFWFTAALIVAAYVASELLGALSTFAYGWFNLNLLHDVRTATYDAMQRVSLGYIESEQTGEIMSILNNDVENLQAFTHGTLSSIIHLPVSTAIALAFMAWLHWQLTLVLLFVPVLIPLISYWHRRVVRPVHQEARERIGSLNALFQNNISGVATIKANAAEERELDRVEAVGRKRRDTHIRQSRIGATSGPTASFVKDLGILTVVVGGGYWILEGAPFVFDQPLTAGVLLTFIIYARSFVQPLRRLPDIVDSYENAQASARRVLGLLTTPAVIPESEGATELETVDGHVEYEDVLFSYGDTPTPALEDVSFEAEPGELIGLVGPTGAGKSTLMKLLFRFYDVDEGAVRIDGHDVRDVTIRSLRRQLGYVGQEPFLFYGTIEENIAYGVPEATETDVVEAATRAGAHEFITELDDGYETMVGERGLKLSGGQRQRVAIARAIVRDPAILVLDESTSHVDNETEAVIQRNLEDLVADRTTFAIAHRLSTVRDADRILVVDDGEIVERGTHEALLDADGLYANLWRVQIGDVADLPEEFIERTRRRQLESSE